MSGEPAVFRHSLPENSTKCKFSDVLWQPRLLENHRSYLPTQFEEPHTNVARMEFQFCPQKQKNRKIGEECPISRGP